VKSIIVILLSAVVVITLTSCQPTGKVPRIENGEQKLTLQTDSAAYLDYISSKPTVTQADAIKGILLLLGEKRQMTFAQAVKTLLDKRIVSPNWQFNPTKPITKGQVAYMAYQLCRMTGGLTILLTGPSCRYCLKELQYRGIMSPGMPYNSVTGMEYVAILGRVDEYLQTGTVSGAEQREGG